MGSNNHAGPWELYQRNSGVGVTFVLSLRGPRLTPRQTFFSPAWVASSLEFAGSFLILEFSGYHLQIIPASPVTFLILWGWSGEHPPWVLAGQGGVLEHCTESPIIHWKVCRGGVTSQGPHPVTASLFPYPAIEPACFSDIVTQLAFCHDRCFHSFPK